MTPLQHIAIPGLVHRTSGKVREIFEVGNDSLLIVATDRISAFDVVLQEGIPDKGRVLTQLSGWWFQQLSPLVPNHCLAVDDAAILPYLERSGVSLEPALKRKLAGRSMLCLKATPLPIECVVRGYLAGSLWKEYVAAGGEHKDVILHGVALPGGLKESEKLPEPIFTPATKATVGHDENISLSAVAERIGSIFAHRVAEISLALYRSAEERARHSGLILADTKFEFGLRNGELIWIDEALTPDSSRYWEASLYRPGQSQPSFDKQFVRDWLEQTGWNKQPPPPTLPLEVVQRTAEKYREAYRRLTGKELPTYEE
ncbi:phosphoribosylaminoimidazole-succinocarboxamide synthase [Chthonomonas calidirosea]|uniref:Phosphoribosylaminoimidazole-succinocarboxamide synthase n=1 Tax=Chthonomonas calidirosea (strain DSM 23976 / ICMP 18418 / T49) TaxID=1303518 RepID=S0EWJ8_CHTCT|nr:phosphoribosylaminoimidazolesuccinocarboxamide synthase [Chthonomonas calidirosea]CCW34729.1 phosphoribosylaminoimidazole-succinocarboxamide synthase [Chthonomonas calidirosea T49]CEK13960.1 phosphoribosylaminoimidazole-succinocarboxamide synthase [Chthonomonas calidirosea]